MAKRDSLGLTDDDCLTRLEQDDSLELLELRESSGGGMYGPWKGDQSKLFLALCSVGITPGRLGRGGSYGYGKAGLIRGSAIRVVFAYTCFEERGDDPGVTRRLLGMTYWGRHEIGGNAYTGFCRFGDSSNAEHMPFCNEAADRLAESLGLTARDPAKPDERGTSLLLVEPTVQPGDLVTAIERYWWPALQDPDLGFEASVVDAQGRKHIPQPRSNAQMQPFIDAYEVATTPGSVSGPHAEFVAMRSIGKYHSPGTLGLRAEVPGWSFPEHAEVEGATDHRSLVALIRKPRMVVEYYDAGRNAPYVRGAFVAADSVNEELRRTEPKSHDAWEGKSASGDIPAEYADLTETLLRRIRARVTRFRSSLKPKPKPSEHLLLPEFDRVMRSLLRGTGTGNRPPPNAERAFTIAPGGAIEKLPNGKVFLSGRAEVGFSEHHAVSDDEGDEIEVAIRYRFMEDERAGDHVSLAIEHPKGFKPVADGASTFRGRLTSGRPVRFEYVSDDYDADWTAKLTVTADFVQPTGTLKPL